MTTVNELLEVLRDNQSLREFYSKKSSKYRCKKCLGKGVIEFQPVEATSRIRGVDDNGKPTSKSNTVFNRYLCRCVVKEAEKEVGNIVII